MQKLFENFKRFLVESTLGMPDLQLRALSGDEFKKKAGLSKPFSAEVYDLFKKGIFYLLRDWSKSQPTSEEFLHGFTDEDWKKYANSVFDGASTMTQVTKQLKKQYASFELQSREEELFGPEDIVRFMGRQKIIQLKKVNKKLRKRHGTAGAPVDCLNGDCLDQMIINNHAPYWARGEVRAMTAKKWIRDYPDRFGGDIKRAKKELKQFVNSLVTNKRGPSGQRKQATGNFEAGRSRRGKSFKYLRRARKGSRPWVVVVHSGASSAWKTVANLYLGGLSTNYEIELDGCVYKYIDAKNATVHAVWMNTHSVGIDLTGKPGSHTATQVNALQALIKKIEIAHDLLPDGPGVNVAAAATFFDNAAAVRRADIGVVAHQSVEQNREDPGPSVMAKLGGKVVKGRGAKTRSRKDNYYKRNRFKTARRRSSVRPTE